MKGIMGSLWEWLFAFLPPRVQWAILGGVLILIALVIVFHLAGAEAP